VASISEDLSKAVVPCKYVFKPDSAHSIAVDFTKDCQERVEAFLRIKQQIKACYASAVVGIHLDIGSGSIAIPTHSNRMLVLCSSAESLRIPDRIKVIRADDFCFCPNLRKVIAGQQRKIDDFRICQKLEQAELSRSVKAVGMEAFSIDEDEGSRSAKVGRVRGLLFLAVGDEWCLRKSDSIPIFTDFSQCRPHDFNFLMPESSSIRKHLYARFLKEIEDRRILITCDLNDTTFRKLFS
jgi:hypothetical protein